MAGCLKIVQNLHDDEWNQKAWTTLAVFQAEGGQSEQARASIRHIGNDPGLIHELHMGPLGRDEARSRVAMMLTSKGHAEQALSLLDEQEDHESPTLDVIGARLEALVSLGKVDDAKVIVQKEVSEHEGFVTDEQTSCVSAFILSLYAKDAKEAEAWVGSLPQTQLRTTGYLTLARAAAGAKPPVYRYFVNWD